MPKKKVPAEAQRNDVDENREQEPENNVIDKEKKRVYNNFTNDQEEEIVDWLKDNPVIYNKRLREYKNAASKKELWKKKAQDMDIDGK